MSKFVIREEVIENIDIWTTVFRKENEFEKIDSKIRRFPEKIIKSLHLKSWDYRTARLLLVYRALVNYRQP